MKVLGINAIGHHEASACVVVDGRVLAFAEEERFTRTKHAVSERPYQAVRWCLESTGLTWGGIDALATGWVEEEYGVTAPSGYQESLSFGVRERGADPRQWPANLRDFVVEAGCPATAVPPLFQVSHHLAHAASAFWCAGLPDAAIVVADGEGDRVSTTLAFGQSNGITLLDQFSTVDSLGQFYACVTSHLGLGPFGEGKLMGLAPYGKSRFDFPEFQTSMDGYRIDLPGALRRWDPAGTDYRAIIRSWQEVLTSRFGSPRPNREAGGPSALSDWPDDDLDLAASTQRALERMLVHLAGSAVRRCGSRNLVLAGGVALNCAANGAIADALAPEHLYVQPVAGDNGVPIGAAMQVAVLAGDVPQPMESVALGPGYPADACAAALAATGLQYRESADIADVAAEHLARDEVVCWFDGRMEGGPRALGQRSILSSPATTAHRDRVNRVKRRAKWRPLAPSLRVEDHDRLLMRGGHAPFMIVADRIVPEWRDRLPGVVHVDDSARPQTVDRSRQPAYWAVIDGFHRRSGLPAVMNTSFNDEREPIVRTPAEAIRTFLRSGADLLCLGPFAVPRPDRAGTPDV